MNAATLDGDPPDSRWNLDFEAIRRGEYSDRYFSHVRDILNALAAEGYQFAGDHAVLAPDAGEAAQRLPVGDLAVDMQVFTRRAPFTIVAGLPIVFEMLRRCAGQFDATGAFRGAAEELSLRSVAEGTMVEPWEPVLRLRGRYRTFCCLETVMLGVLARASRIATNTYKAITATRGKPIVFLSARFDHPANQPLDGYAYKVGLEAFHHRTGIAVEPLATTPAHARNWGREDGSGTSHSFILCFLRDTAEAMLHYARLAPPEVRRVAVVDANNDCVGESIAVARSLFERYQQLLDAGRHDEARRYKLYAVRPDTSRNMRDRQVPPLGDPALDCGVTPRLVHLIREALDHAPLHMNLPLSWMEPCRRYFRDIRIFVTGGFDPDRIRLFEDLQVPVDMYGVGSYLVRGRANDFTADVVEVEIEPARWIPMAKAGRGPRESPQLAPARLA